MGTVSVTVADHVATVTLNRPDVRNALNREMIADLDLAIQRLGVSPMVRAIVLAGNGPAFCAGTDLDWLRKTVDCPDTQGQTRADAMVMAGMLHTIWSCPKPVIARVHGDAYAGGLGLVAACDIVVAADTAGFCPSEARLGLLPAAISPYVIRAIGEQAARRYFLTAERFDAREAHRLGLVHVMVKAAALDDAVAGLTTALLRNGPHAVRKSKRLVQEMADLPIDRSLIAETAARVAQIRCSEEGREGVLAFLEKRTASWAIT